MCNPLACSNLKTFTQQQTLEDLLQDLLLSMPQSQQRQSCHASAPKYQDGSLKGLGSTDGLTASQGFGHSWPVTESLGFGGGGLPSTHQTCSASGLLNEDNHTEAACLLAPQVLNCGVGDQEAFHLPHPGFLTGSKHMSVKDAKAEKMFQRDVITQPALTKLLLMKQQQQRQEEMTEASSGLLGLQLREAETLQLHLQERLRTEQQRNAHLAASFQQVCEALKAKLSLMESGSERLSGQLQAVVEKYSRLRKRASSTKRRLLHEVKDKEKVQTSLKEAQKDKQELDAQVSLLCEQKEAAQQERSVFRIKLQVAEQQRGEAVRNKEVLEEELSKFKTDVECLTLQLGRSQRESERLVKSARSRDLERDAGLKTLQELQDTVKSLYARLERSGAEKQAALDEMEALKQEAKLQHNRCAEDLPVQSSISTLNSHLSLYLLSTF